MHSGIPAAHTPVSTSPRPDLEHPAARPKPVLDDIPHPAPREAEPIKLHLP